MNRIIDYYEKNAQKYYERTNNVNNNDDFHKTRNILLKYLKKGNHILDLGCGSGRDSKLFLRSGFKVTAIDGSKRLCELASDLIGQEVICKEYSEINDVNVYDAIWASASLLHLTNSELKHIIEKMIIALKVNGYFYLSFKYGDSEREKNGRFFNDMNEDKFNEILSELKNLKLVEYVTINDTREGRNDERWLHIILKRIKKNY